MTKIVRDKVTCNKLNRDISEIWWCYSGGGILVDICIKPQISKKASRVIPFNRLGFGPIGIPARTTQRPSARPFWKTQQAEASRTTVAAQWSEAPPFQTLHRPAQRTLAE